MAYGFGVAGAQDFVTQTEAHEPRFSRVLLAPD